MQQSSSRACTISPIVETMGLLVFFKANHHDHSLPQQLHYAAGINTQHQRQRIIFCSLANLTHYATTGHACSLLNKVSSPSPLMIALILITATCPEWKQSFIVVIPFKKKRTKLNIAISNMAPTTIL